MIGRVEEGPARQFHKVGMTLGIFRQQRENAALQFAQLARVLAHIAKVDFEAAADDRLIPPPAKFPKIQCSERLFRSVIASAGIRAPWRSRQAA
jgi:hypothetical protein